MRVKKKKTGSGRVFQIGITVHINTNVVAAHGKTFSPRAMLLSCSQLPSKILPVKKENVE